jgi:hypothetical protein
MSLNDTLRAIHDAHILLQDAQLTLAALSDLHQLFTKARNKKAFLAEKKTYFLLALCNQLAAKESDKLTWLADETMQTWKDMTAD